LTVARLHHTQNMMVHITVLVCFLLLVLDYPLFGSPTKQPTVYVMNQIHSPLGLIFSCCAHLKSSIDPSRLAFGITTNNAVNTTPRIQRSCYCQHDNNATYGCNSAPVIYTSKPNITASVRNSTTKDILTKKSLSYKNSYVQAIGIILYLIICACFKTFHATRKMHPSFGVLLMVALFTSGISAQNTTLTKRRVQGASSDIVGYWPMKSSTSSVADCNDYSISGNNIVCGSSTSYVTSYVTSVRGGASNAVGVKVQSNGLYCNSVIKTSATNLPTGSYTIASFLYLNKNAAQNGQSFFSFGSQAGYYTGIMFNSAGQLYAYFKISKSPFTSWQIPLLIAPTNAQWYDHTLFSYIITGFM
jgi:hypothetical protein